MTALDQISERMNQDGYAIVVGLMTEPELNEIGKCVRQLYPTQEERLNKRHHYPALASGSAVVEAPFWFPTLNYVAVHPRVLAIVEKVLGTSDLRLLQSLLWIKYGGGKFSQQLHRDYRDTSLLPPTVGHGRFDHVAAIVYYEDVSEDAGPTKVISRTRSADVGRVPAGLTDEQSSALEEREISVVVPAGSALFFSGDVLHRASDITNVARRRVSHHLAWGRSASPWVGWASWPRLYHDGRMRSWIAEMTPRARQVLGFPAPGDDYWTESTITETEALYPGIDMTPYREAQPSHG